MDTKKFFEVCLLYENEYIKGIDDIIFYLISKYHCVTKQEYEIIKEFFI